MSDEIINSDLQPIILKLVRKKTKHPTNGSVAQQLVVLDAATGRPIAGIIGAGVELFGGVMFLGVKVQVFEEETIESEGVLVAGPGDMVPPIGKLGPIGPIGSRFKGRNGS